jgi:hypothetical protein
MIKNMKNIFRLFSVIVIIAGAVFSCNKYRSPDTRGAIEDRRTARESRYNLMGFPGDDSVITAGVPAADDTVRTKFSVQLFASKSSSEADRFLSEVKSLFDEVAITDYKAPYYKVRVGETSTLEEGEALLEKVRRLGFPNAWLVRIRY